MTDSSRSDAPSIGAGPTLGERILALPEQHATKSRDYGRGYAQAVRDVYGLLYAHDGHHTLGEPCGCDPETVAAQKRLII